MTVFFCFHPAACSCPVPDWPSPASFSWEPHSLDLAWGFLAVFSPSAFTMVPFCGFPTDRGFQPHSWERQPRKASCWNAQGPETLPFVVVWFVPGCPCKTFMKMLLYLHGRLKISVNLESLVPQECRALRKCCGPPF